MPRYREPLPLLGVGVVIVALCFGSVLAYQEPRKRQARRECETFAEGAIERLTPVQRPAAAPRYVDRVVKQHIPLDSNLDPSGLRAFEFAPGESREIWWL